MTRFLSRLLLSLCSVAVALSLGEALARLTTPIQRGASWYQYDPRFEFRHRENLDVTTTEWGEGLPWRLRTNSRGFRGGEWPAEPDHGRWRLLVAGDSFTFGNAVDENQTFPSLAEASLRRDSPDWEVVNLGVSAWGPENALAWLDSEGRGIGASCLVYAFYNGNDMLDESRSQLFSFEGGERRRRPSASRETGMARARGVVRRIPGYEFLLAHSQLFNVIRSAALRAVFRGVPNREADGAAPIGPVPASQRAQSTSYEQTLQALSHLRSLAIRRFGCFGVLSIPSRDQLLKGGPSAKLSRESEAALVEWATREGAPVRLAAGAFPAEESAIRRLFFSADFHCNSAGSALLGGELAAFAWELRETSREPGSEQTQKSDPSGMAHAW